MSDAVSADEIVGLHSTEWESCTLVVIFDLTDGGSAVQTWTIGKSLGSLIRVD